MDTTRRPDRKVAHHLAFATFAAVAFVACEPEAMMPSSEPNARMTAASDASWTASVKFCNELDIELTLRVGAADSALLLVAPPRKCSSEVSQPCGRAPSGMQPLALLRGQKVVASGKFWMEGEAATLVRAPANSDVPIALVRLSTVDSCPKTDPFGSKDEGPTGPLTCRELKNCIRDCGQDGACEAACDGRAAPGEKAKFDAVEVCLRANQCKDEACIVQNCGKELSACPATGSMPL